MPRGKPKPGAIEAIAEAWASIDGRLDHFHLCRMNAEAERLLGHYEGYMAEAKELIERVAARGFTLRKIKP